jgi:hypothetical protein
MKKTIIGFLIVVSLVTLIYGRSTNWFQSATFTGNLMPDTTTRVYPISLNIGNLESGSNFNVTGSSTIVVGQSNGINLSNVLITPNLFIPTDTRPDYWLSRFIDLYLNFTLDNTTYTMPIIESSKLMVGYEGSTMLGWDDVLHSSFGRTEPDAEYCYYALWNVTHLDQGIHTTQFDLYGLSNLANQPLPIEVDFSLELTL